MDVIADVVVVSEAFSDIVRCSVVVCLWQSVVKVLNLSVDYFNRQTTV